MKKAIYGIIFFFFLTVTITVEGNSCPGNCRIKDNPSPGLERYFQNVETILSNLNSHSRSSSNNQSFISDLNAERQRVIGSLNRTLNFGEYYCSFDYFVSLNITNETPSQVRRDSQRLEQIGERINQILENTERRGAGGFIGENICNGVQNCSFTGRETLRDILVRLAQNNSVILQHFRASILEKPCAPNSDLILVPGNFLSELQLYYNKDTLTACSSCKDEFAGRTMERIQNISFKNSNYREGMQAWRDAWAMLKGGFSPSGNPETRERNRDEGLERDGKNSNIVNIIHNNRERYNAGGLSTNSTDENASSNARTQVNPSIPSFNEALRQEMQGRESIPISAVPRTQGEISRTQTISDTISDMYNSQIPYSLIQDTQSEETLLRMIRMHVRLSESINLLERFRPRSERVCDRQGTGMGQCTYR